jgi:hypothetical protein
MNVCSNSNRWSAKAFWPADMYLYGFRNIMSIPDLFFLFLLMFASRPSDKDWTYISEVYITVWSGLDSRWEHAHLYESFSLVNSMNYNSVIQSLRFVNNSCYFVQVLHSTVYGDPLWETSLSYFLLQGNKKNYNEWLCSYMTLQSYG